MNSKREKKWSAWWRTLTVKQRLSLRDSEDGDEKWYMYISPMHVFAGFLAVVLILFVVVMLTVAYTPILDMIPGYPGSRSREALMREIVRLDSLEREMDHLTVYSDNIALIMEGKTPIVRDVTAIGDSVTVVGTKEIVPPNGADSALRAQMEGSGPYGLVTSSRNDKRASLDLVAPVHGVPERKFSPREGSYGVTILTNGVQPVVAVKDGTVVLSVWSPEDGYVVQIQHSDNLLSVYKHNTLVGKTVGSRVRAGEIIASTGAEEGEQGAAFEFELWYNGTPVDPEGYIVF